MQVTGWATGSPVTCGVPDTGEELPRVAPPSAYAPRGMALAVRLARAHNSNESSTRVIETADPLISHRSSAGQSIGLLSRGSQVRFLPVTPCI